MKFTEYKSLVFKAINGLYSPMEYTKLSGYSFVHIENCIADNWKNGIRIDCTVAYLVSIIKLWYFNEGDTK